MKSFLDGHVTLWQGDCREVLREFADNSVDSVVTDKRLRSSPNNRYLEIGKAAEHLVCADLILAGHRAFLSDQGLPYDVVFDHDGKLLRVQVKSSSRPRPVPNRPGPSSYMFHIRRAGKGAKRIIRNDEFDILALVALDIRAIAYRSITDRVLQTIHLRMPGEYSKFYGAKKKRNGSIDSYPINAALKEMGL